MKDKSAKFLLDAEREEIIATLKSAGIETEKLSDAELLSQLRDTVKEVKKLREDLVKASAKDGTKSQLSMSLNAYLNTHDSLLTDKAFVARLFEMHVPPCFLKLFRDADASFSDQKIWEVIRYSGIKVYEHNLNELLSRRRPLKNKSHALAVQRQSLSL
jgi:hypothetical protein